MGLEGGGRLETFTKPIPVALYLLASAQRVDRSRSHRQSLAATAHYAGPQADTGLVAGHGRRNVFASKKRGLEVGNTKKGKGTKLMLMIEGQGLPISAFTTSAQDAEVHTIETLVDLRVLNKRPSFFLYDKAADADWMRDALAKRGIEQVTPHRSGRKKAKRQDGRHLKRYRHRWKIERTIAWLGNQRRLLVRHEYNAHLFEGFVHWGCLLLCIKWF